MQADLLLLLVGLLCFCKGPLQLRQFFFDRCNGGSLAPGGGLGSRYIHLEVQALGGPWGSFRVWFNAVHVVIVTAFLFCTSKLGLLCLELPALLGKLVFLRGKFALGTFLCGKGFPCRPVNYFLLAQDDPEGVHLAQQVHRVIERLGHDDAILPQPVRNDEVQVLEPLRERRERFLERAFSAVLDPFKEEQVPGRGVGATEVAILLPLEDLVHDNHLNFRLHKRIVEAV